MEDPFVFHMNGSFDRFFIWFVVLKLFYNELQLWHIRSLIAVSCGAIVDET